MQKTIPVHGNPENKVFGLKGSFIGTDLGKLFLKQEQDTLNVGWVELTGVATTTTTTAAPTTTTTAAATTTTAAATTTTAAATTTTAAPTTTTAAATTTTAAPTTTTTSSPPPITTTTAAPTTTTTAAATTTTTAGATTTTAAPTTTTAAPTTTTTAAPFSVNNIEVTGATKCGGNNDLIAGVVASGGTATIIYSITWGTAASVSNPVYISGFFSGTLTSGETSISATTTTITGASTLTFSRPNASVADVATIVITRQSDTPGILINASARCLVTPSNAVQLNVGLITPTGNYKYRVRDCSAGSNSDTENQTSTSQVVTSGAVSDRISYLELISQSGTFAAPSLSVTSCTTTTTAAPTTTTAAATTTTAAVTTTTTAEGTTTTAEATTTTTAEATTTTTAEGTTTTEEATTTTEEATTTTEEATTTTEEATTTPAPACNFYTNNTGLTYMGSVTLCGGAFGVDTIPDGTDSNFCLQSAPIAGFNVSNSCS